MTKSCPVARRDPTQTAPDTTCEIKPNTTSPSGISVLVVAVVPILPTLGTMSLVWANVTRFGPPLPILVNHYLV